MEMDSSEGKLSHGPGAIELAPAERSSRPSERQMAANRRNALKSTGPRSLAGRTRSSQNAIKHGLTATQTMLPGESEEEFAGLRHSMFASLKPEGVLENQLVERAASLLWRMRRFQAFEVAVFKWASYLQAAEHDGGEDDPDGRRNDPFDPELDHDRDLKDQLRVGRMFEALLSADLTGRLTRYETALQRQLSLTLQELRHMQRPRHDEETEVRRERARIKAKEGLVDPHDDPRYWDKVERQRLKRSDPP